MRITVTFILSMLSLLIIAETLDLTNLSNYTNQPNPGNLSDRSSRGNRTTDIGATLGRVLFYDQRLSTTDSISCASCHKQEDAFGDRGNVVSTGVEGRQTGRHSPRILNIKYGVEQRMFWDERASRVENQATMPIQDFNEMGWSGENGQPGMNDLIAKMDTIPYYKSLFSLVFGDDNITEAKIGQALAQFLNSIQSFDSRFDQGMSLVSNIRSDFPNYTAEENLGKLLYLTTPRGSTSGGGCNQCHRAPAFDIDPRSRNNGIVGVANDPGAIDTRNTRSPSLRDMVDPNGDEIGPFMHDGSLETLRDVIDHYNSIPRVTGNNRLDRRLNSALQGRNGTGGLGLTNSEKSALVAFLKTLGGTNIFIDPKWSNPFNEDGSLTTFDGSREVTSFPLIELGCEIPTRLSQQLNANGIVVLAWDPEETAESYTLQVRIAGSNRWVLNLPLNRNRIVLRGRNNTYEYRVSANCGDDQSDFSEIAAFTITNNLTEQVAQSRSSNVHVKEIDLVEEFETFSSLVLYPNPVKDVLNVQYTPAASTMVRLHNSAGQLVLEQPLVEGTNLHRLQVGNFDAGMYIVTIRTEGELMETEQIIKR